MKEKSARVQRWRELLTQYDFEVRYKPGKENVVADWLSRAHKVNVTTQEEGTSGPSLRQFFRTWDPDGEQVSEGESGHNSEATVSADETREPMEEAQEAIAGKKRAIIWVATTQGLPSIQYGRRTRSSLRCTVRAPLSASDDQIRRLLEDASLPRVTTYIYVGNATAWQKIARVWADGNLVTDRKFIRCLNLGERVEDQQTQRDIVLAHHQGKTNHRGIEETLASLRRKYYWRGMKNMVREVITNCDTCLQVKYARTPVHVPQEVSLTAEKPLTLVQVDVFTWQGELWMTMVDTFSKVATAVPIQAKSAEETLKTFRRWAQTYGTPGTIVTDGGREFRNQAVQELLRTWGTAHHITTAGHPQSHGVVERFHNTLGEHLRALHTERGIVGREAMELAVIAYNHSVHSTTGFTPFEILFGTLHLGRDVADQEGEPGAVEAVNQLRRHLSRTHEKVYRRLRAEKEHRVTKHNDRLKPPGRGLQIGDTVFREVVSNRSKQVQRYEGPYKVVALHERNRVTIRAEGEASRQRTVHREQLRIAGTAGKGEARGDDRE